MKVKAAKFAIFIAEKEETEKTAREKADKSDRETTEKDTAKEIYKEADKDEDHEKQIFRLNKYIENSSKDFEETKKVIKQLC